MNESEKAKPQEVSVEFPDTLKGGAYSDLPRLVQV